MTISRRGKIALIGVTLAASALLVVGAVDGRAAVEKIALRILTPVGLLWLGLACQTLWTCVRRQRMAALWSGALLLAVTLLGNGLLAGALLARLERPYLHIDPLVAPAFDTLIVLGGGTSTGATGRPQLNPAGDRLLLAAQMYHAGKAQRLICTGERIRELNPDGLDPAEQSQQVLESLGVPRAAIEQSGGRTTSEEFQQLGRTLSPTEHVGLVTSAWHMSRAQRLATVNGLHVDPVPADFQGPPPEENRSVGGAGAILMSLIPSADAMAAAATVWKEQLARLVGR